MDKILFVDFMNAMWRSSIIFGEKKTHTFCDYCDEDILHSDIGTHCVECKVKWDDIENKCSKDNSVNIITFNFFRNLRPIVEKFLPNKIFFVLEGRPKHRYALYSQYKGNRVKFGSKQKDAQDIKEASSKVLSILDYFPVTMVKSDDYECDDVISTLVDSMSTEELIVVSNDSDYIQLLQKGYNHIKIYNHMKKDYMVAPDYHYVAWKSLNGDKSDNIPGLVTPKKALDLVKSPDLLKKFLSIEENRANFIVNKQLIEFADVPQESFIVKEGFKNFEEVEKVFKELEFNSILKNFDVYKSTFDCVTL